ncbi:MAG: hypothetical protein NG740_05315, partial [Omnitrophica bacterium]|nr:hypothetical protein [Candidatus Omnitrophota bacterium]
MGKEFIINNEDIRMAPCLKDGLLAEIGNKLIRELRGLGDSSISSILRTWTVSRIYSKMEDILASDQEP